MQLDIFMAEVFGTMILILLGDGVVAGVLLAKTKSNNSGWIVITMAWAFAVFAGVVVAGPFSGAHLNPAVTVGIYAKDLLAGNEIDVALFGTYIVAEMIGAMIGAFLVFLHYYPHWAETEDPGLKLAVFSTGPAIRNTVWNFWSEVVGTFVLVFVIFCFGNNAAGQGRPRAPSARSRLPSSSWSSALPSAARPGTRSTRPATSGRGSCTRSCRSPARAAPTGPTRGSRSSARSSAASSRRSSTS